MEKIHILPNSRVKLRCNATGFISLKKPEYYATNDNNNHNNNLNNNNNNDIQWYKDGKLIEQDSRRLKKWVSSYDNSNYMELELYALDSDDSGNYQCKRDKSILKNIYLNVSENNRAASDLHSSFSSFCICLLFIDFIVYKILFIC